MRVFLVFNSLTHFVISALRFPQDPDFFTAWNSINCICSWCTMQYPFSTARPLKWTVPRYIYVLDTWIIISLWYLSLILFYLDIWLLQFISNILLWTHRTSSRHICYSCLMLFLISFMVAFRPFSISFFFVHPHKKIVISLFWLKLFFQLM